MQRTSLLVVGLLFTATLVGGVGPALAQSDGELVTLTLEVVNPSSNQRLGGVTLLVTWDDGGETRVTTASNGMALVDVPEAASVEITPDDDAYTRNEPYRIRVATEKEHTIEVARKAELGVVVTDTRGPVADARVSLSQDGTVVASGRTDANGRYDSGTIEQGQYTLSAVKPGYYRTTENVIVAGTPEQTVSIESGRVDYDIVVEDPHFDPAESVADATVSVEGVGTTTTDDRGSAAALFPVNSELRVTVSKEGYGTVTETVTTNESRGSLALGLSREPSLSLTAVNQRVVVGEVVPVEVTNAYGEPASGVAVLVDGEQVAETGSDGRATVRIEEPGDRRIQARSGGTTSEAVTVRGIGEGSGATDQTTVTADDTQVTGTAVATGADDSGLLPGTLSGLLAPLVAIVVVLLLLVGAIALYLRRRGARNADPSAWADDPLESTAGGGAVGFGGDGESGTETTDNTAVDTGSEPVTEDERGTDVEGASDETDAGTDTGTEETDAGTDTGTEETDAGTDTGTEEMDAGTDTGTDETDAGTEDDPVEEPKKEPESTDTGGTGPEDGDEPQ